MEKGKLRFLCCSPTTINPLAQDPGLTDTDIKTTNNAKINHIMVSFTNHYNATSLDRHPSKTRIGKN